MTVPDDDFTPDPSVLAQTLIEGLREAAEAAEHRGGVLITEAEKMRALGQALINQAAEMTEVASALAGVIERVPKPSVAKAAKVAVVAPDEVEDVKPPPKVTGEKGEVTLKHAANAATRLGRFTRSDLATELGLSPLAVGRWIAQLQDREIIAAVGSDFEIRVPQSQPDQDLTPRPPKEREPESTADFDRLQMMPAMQGSGPMGQRIRAAEGQIEVLDFVDREGEVVGPEVAEALSLTKEKASRYLRDLADAGLILRTGVNRHPRGREAQVGGRAGVEFASLVRRKSVEVKPAPEASLTEQEVEVLARVRDHVTKTTEPVSPFQVGRALDLPPDVCEAALETLVDRHVMTDESPAADMRLFQYQPPKGPGRAAQMDAARRKSSDARDVADPVAGTGKQLKANNAEVQALIRAAEAAGAEVTHAANGHFAVITPEGKRVLISSTPSNPRSVMNDKSRLRKAGLKV